MWQLLMPSTTVASCAVFALLLALDLESCNDDPSDSIIDDHCFGLPCFNGVAIRQGPDSIFVRFKADIHAPLEALSIYLVINKRMIVPVWSAMSHPRGQLTVDSRPFPIGLEEESTIDINFTYSSQNRYLSLSTPLTVYAFPEHLVTAHPHSFRKELANYLLVRNGFTTTTPISEVRDKDTLLYKEVRRLTRSRGITRITTGGISYEIRPGEYLDTLVYQGQYALFEPESFSRSLLENMDLFSPKDSLNTKP